MRIIAIALLGVAVSLSGGCRNKEKEARREALISLMHGNTKDPDMAAAIEKSRATVGEFLTALKKPASNQRQFMVRREFPTDKPGVRQILIVNHLTYEGGMIRGKLDDNTARPGSGVPRSGEVAFSPAEVCDWMYNEDGKAVGGFMLRALLGKMTDEERRAYSEKIQFKD